MYVLKPMRGESALITGGLGFIGSNIAHRLVSLGAHVTVYDACLDPYGWNFANIREIKDSVKFIKGDTRDIELLKEHVRDKDFVFDCAAQVSHNLSIKKPFLDVDINCRGALNVLEAVRHCGGKAKVVYAGTRGELGRLERTPADETHPTNPVDINGINKLAAEKYNLLYNKIYGIRTTSIRINNTYGPRSQMRNDDYGIVNWFIRRALLGEEIVMHGEGNQTRDFNYVDDVVDAMVLAAQSDKADGEVFLLGSGKETKFADVLKLIIEITGSGSRIRRIPRPKEREAIEIGNFLVSFDKIRSTLGWNPKVSLEDGISKTVEFYRQRIGEYV